MTTVSDLPDAAPGGMPSTGVSSLLDRLDAEQRVAALLPDGPAQIIAPAGSGKTTTLIARLGVLLARGVAANQICIVTFNRDAAAELVTRIGARLRPLVPTAGEIEVRTLHALARQVLLDAGQAVELVADRLPLLRAALRRAAAGRAPDVAPLPDVASLDTILSAWKIEGRAPPPKAETALAGYEALLAARGAIDFDDLVAGAARLLDEDRPLRHRWQRRFSHVLVDEFQDVDSAQLRLVRALAEPERNLFVVGDDDQTIYAWRLADVRRILDFAHSYPDARRVMLATNYRCPPAVVTGSRLLIEVNVERFAKRIEPAPGAAVEARVVSLFPTDAPEWPDRLAAFGDASARAGRRVCFLARTRSELAPVLLALVRAGVQHATSIAGPLDAKPVEDLLEQLRAVPGRVAPFETLLRLRAARGWRRGDDDALSDDDHAALDAAIGWAAAYRSAGELLTAYDVARERIARLRDPDASVELVTVHGAKGREWETVVLVGFEEERFPNRRALVDHGDPARALEEERRLAYVALTRAGRRLVLAFHPARPSRFLAEMGYRTAVAAAPRARNQSARSAASLPGGKTG